jgi:hypothetical protein
MSGSGPIVIIGAPRSGTNMLRDVLTRVPGLATWPCDEIDAIWRHGNLRAPSDEFGVQHATPYVRAFIRTRFERLRRSTGAERVVEKTCASSLRVPFIDAILPEAVFVWIVRDGRDAVPSAMKRWTGSAGVAYMARKVRFVPPSDVPYYAWRFAANRVHRLLNGEKRVGVWGPRFDGWREALERGGLPEVCALQWVRCVDAAEAGLGRLDPARVHRVRYEEFVREPARELSRLGEFLAIRGLDTRAAEIAGDVSPRSVGRGLQELDDGTRERIEPLMRATLGRLGYA